MAENEPIILPKRPSLFLSGYFRNFYHEINLNTNLSISSKQLCDYIQTTVLKHVNQSNSICYNSKIPLEPIQDTLNKLRSLILIQHPFETIQKQEIENIIIRYWVEDEWDEQCLSFIKSEPQPIIESKALHSSLIAGYIRRFDEKNLLTYQIPTDIIHLIRIFAVLERWNDKCIAYRVIINENDVMQWKNGPSSVYLMNVVESGRHIWTFKIETISNKYTDIKNKFMLFGIFKANEYNQNPDDIFIKRNNSGYGFIASHAHKSLPEVGGWIGYKYGKKCNKGDVIEMCLDFNDCSLSYRINQVAFGKAFDIDKTKYCGAVSMHYKKDKVFLMSYKLD
eukprot:216167_1